MTLNPASTGGGTMALDRSTLAAALAAQRPGYCLDRVFYTDPAIFEAEIDRVFFRSWWFAGHGSEIPRPGDYLLFELAGESLIVLRQPDRSVAALFNVCRHRGSRICRESAGSVKKLVCPYHAWVYETDGRLLAARHMPDDFDPAQHGLRPAAVRVVEGLIFVHLGPAPVDFDPTARAVSLLFARHRLGDAVVAHHETYQLRCNWKIAAENTWECYHCTHAHPEYCSVMTHATAFESPRRTAERESALRSWQEQARQLGRLPSAEALAVSPDHFLNATPIRDGWQTQSADGRPLAPLLGDFTEYDGGLHGFMTYPIVWFAASNDHALLVRFAPRDPLTTEVRYTWLVRAGAQPGVDFDVDRLTWLWRTTADQDQRICEDNQAGVQSRVYQPGPYSTVESGAAGFTRWYLERMTHVA
jgi:Rieske 2Fe-2S family protein